MATVTFSKKYLLRLLNIKLSDEELERQIGKIGFEIAGIDADEITLEITPNRSDLFGAVGFARSLKNFMHRSKKLKYEIKSNEPALEITVGKKIQKSRPYMVSLVARNLDMDEESLTDLINFTEKLCEINGRNRKKVSIGLHDLDAVEPPLYYDAFPDETFVALNETRPRHYSDIVKDHEKGKQYAFTLEGRNEFPVIKDAKGTLSLIPILNSARTRVTKETKNILVDMTGTSSEAVNRSIDMLACVFMDMGADVSRVRVSYPEKTQIVPIMSTKQISMPLNQIENEIGVSIGFNNIISLANKMGYEAALLGKSIRFRVPEYRIDVINEQDVIEDIAIAYGYDYIQAIPVPSIQKGSLERKGLFLEKAAESMIGLGYGEMLNTYLTNEKINFENMGIKDVRSHLSKYAMDYVRLKNPKAQSLSMMRTWLLPSLMRNIGASTHEKMPQRLFEMDMIFYLHNRIPKEDYHLAGISADPKANFNYMKGTVEALLGSLGFDFRIEKEEHEGFIKGRCAKISTDGKFIGFFGEIHPEVLNNFGIEEPCVAFEINLP